MSLRRRIVPVLAVPLLLLATAASQPFPRSIPLPLDFAPEGIAVGTGTTFYTGSLIDGDIYRGDLRTGEGAVLVDQADGQAVGMKVDERRDRLFVAGGFTGRGLVYDTDDGSTVAGYFFGSDAFVNDVALGKDAAYFTDSFNPRIYRVPIAADGTLGPTETITVTGPASPIVEGIGLNGIDVTPDGDTLIVGNTGLDAVFTVDPDTGVSSPIVIPGGPLPDSNDGILLHGKVLWIVANFSNTVLKVRLSPDLASGRIVDTLTNDDVDGLFRVPTTLAMHGNRLVLVNARFDIGFPPPFGPGWPPGTDFDVVQVDKP